MPTREEIALNPAAVTRSLQVYNAFAEDEHDADWCRRGPLEAAIRAYILTLPSPAPVGEWRPIESAPRDGTEVIVYFARPHLGVRQVRWENLYGETTPDEGIWCTDDNKHGPYAMRGYIDGDDTHWMPLPEPPAQQTAAAEAREEGR